LQAPQATLAAHGLHGLHADAAHGFLAAHGFSAAQLATPGVVAIATPISDTPPATPSANGAIATVVSNLDLSTAMNSSLWRRTIPLEDQCWHTSWSKHGTGSRWVVIRSHIGELPSNLTKRNNGSRQVRKLARFT